MYQTASRNLAGVRDLILVPKGTASRNGRIPISSSLGLMQSIAEGTFQGDGSGVFEVCCLDDFFDNQPMTPTFIKMDIEGAELDTLAGAAEIIKRGNPQMAICVYHKQNDILAIPQFLRACHADYKFYLRHYSDNSTETVLYAV